MGKFDCASKSATVSSIEADQLRGLGPNCCGICGHP